jgi:HEAT repeat protein
VAEAFGKIGDPRAVDALIERLADTKYVAKYAAQALGRIGDPRAVAPLLRELESDCWERRAHAAGALGARGDRRALAPLIACLGDAEWLVRRAAADSLERFGLTLPRDLADGCKQMTEPERDEIRARFGLPLQGKADEY